MDAGVAHARVRVKIALKAQKQKRLKVECKAKDEEGVTVFFAKRQSIMEATHMFERSEQLTGWQTRGRGYV